MRAIKARWLREQAHQQLKGELGLDHFEGRSWSGLHLHALLTMIVFAYLQQGRLAAARQGKKLTRPPPGPPPQPSLPAVRRALVAALHAAARLRCPHCHAQLPQLQRE